MSEPRKVEETKSVGNPEIQINLSERNVTEETGSSFSPHLHNSKLKTNPVKVQVLFSQDRSVPTNICEDARDSCDVTTNVCEKNGDARDSCDVTTNVDFLDTIDSLNTKDIINYDVLIHPDDDINTVKNINTDDKINSENIINTKDNIIIDESINTYDVITNNEPVEPANSSDITPNRVEAIFNEDKIRNDFHEEIRDRFDHVSAEEMLPNMFNEEIMEELPNDFDEDIIDVLPDDIDGEILPNIFADSTNENDYPTAEEEKCQAQIQSAKRSLITNLVIFCSFLICSFLIVFLQKIERIYFIIFLGTFLKALLPIFTAIANFGTVQSVFSQYWEYFKQ